MARASLVGATASAAVGITLKDSPMVVLLPMVLLVGVLAGGVYAWIAAWLMDRFGVNEILSTVLLNFVSFGIVDYVASEVWSDPAAGHPTTVPIGDGGLLPLIGTPPMHRAWCSRSWSAWRRWSSCAAPCRATSSGPSAPTRGPPRSTGCGSAASRSARWWSAALAGPGPSRSPGSTASSSRACSPTTCCSASSSASLRGATLAVPFVAFGIAVLEVGASAMQRTADVPSEMVLITEALILLFLLSPTSSGPAWRRSSR